MLRSMVLAISRRRLVRKLVTGGPGRTVALRFVAGETLDDAMRAVNELRGMDIDVSLDHLGENVGDLHAAATARDVYLEMLDELRAQAVEANVSVKLTQLGLDVDPVSAADNAGKILERATSVGCTVTLDMEDHRYTDRTIQTVLNLAGGEPARVGLALQAYLLRTPEDMARCTAAGVHVRLCKGAYKEPAAIAYRSRAKVSEAYARLTTQLLSSPSYAMIATHDGALIEHAASEVERLGRTPDSFEFQMLYGVRRELQKELLARGFRVRVYVPFGGQWYPYLMRRIAERPANIRFFTEALLRG